MKPKLIHPVDVGLCRRDKDTPLNLAYDEPEEEMQYLPAQTFEGQISYKVRNQATPEGLGNAPQASGYVLCYAQTWDMLGGTVGDLLEIPGETKCVVVEMRPAAHYQGQHWLYKVFFERLRAGGKP